MIRAIFRDTTIEAFEGCLYWWQTPPCGLIGQMLVRFAPRGQDEAGLPAAGFFGRSSQAAPRRRRSGNRPSRPSREAGQTPRSVISAVTSRAGVTSNAKFAAGLRRGQPHLDPLAVLGPAGDMRDLARVALLDRDVGAVRRASSRLSATATRHRTARRCRAPRAPSDRCRSCSRHRPRRSCGRCRRCTDRRAPCRIRWPPALSAMTVCGTPCWPSSQAVRLAPWLRGRVSSTQTCSGMPASCAR